MEGFGAPSEAEDAFAPAAPEAMLSNFPPAWHSFITDGGAPLPPQAVAAQAPPVWTNQAWEEPLWTQAPPPPMAPRQVEADALATQMPAEHYYPTEQMYPTDGVLKTMFDEPDGDFRQQPIDGQPNMRRRPGSPGALRAESMVAGLLETPSSSGTTRTPGSQALPTPYMTPGMNAGDPGPSSFSGNANRTPDRKPARFPYQEDRPHVNSSASNPSFSPTLHSSNSAFAEVRRSYPSTPTEPPQQWAHGYSSQQGSAPIPIGNIGQGGDRVGGAEGGMQASSYPVGLATPPRPRPTGADYGQHMHYGMAQSPGQAETPWYLKSAATGTGAALETEPNPNFIPAAGNDFVAYGNPGQTQGMMDLGAHPSGQHSHPKSGLAAAQPGSQAAQSSNVNAGSSNSQNPGYMMQLVPVQLASGERIFVPPNILQNFELGLVGLKSNSAAPPKPSSVGHTPHTAPHAAPHAAQHASLGVKHKVGGSAASTPSRSRATRSHQDAESERHTSPGQASRASNAPDPLAQKRAELNESPYTKDQFKRVHLKLKQFGSLELARNFASACCAILPQKVHWRLVFELADLAKRENRIYLARKLFEQVCRMQPCSGQGWVEFAKLEEERGAFDRAAHVLRVGLECCGYNEHLLFRALRLEEKRGNLTGARELLAPLCNERIDQVWRTILEGAALEVRAGNFEIARKVYKYLMAHVGWYGPIYHEACRLEERAGRFSHAKAIVQRGLREVSRYGPLWFDAFRLSERLDIEDGTGLIAMGHRPQMKRTRETLAMALKVITKELVWKVHYERAQIEDRVAAALARGLQLIRQAGGAPLSANQLVQVRNELLVHSRWAYANAATACPPNLRWKVWLAAARTELGVGRADLARLLVKRSMREIPPKARYMAWLEMSRIEEFVGDLQSAREILCAARQEAVTEWKIFLESVMLELRSGHIREATLQAETALEVHRGTGRLWAALITLRASDGVAAQAAVFRRALQEVPKSGEVWAEGARLHMNPLSELFDPECAARFLEFAILFTPQYGDSFLELIRLRLVLRCLLPQALLLYRRGKHGVEEQPDAAEPVADVKRGNDEDETTVRVQGIDLHPVPSRTFEGVDVSDIDLRCGNAGPNYGSLWFHCRGGPSGGVNGLVPWCGVSSSGTVRKAREMMAKELAKTQGVYVAALLRWLQVRHDAMRYSRKTGDASTGTLEPTPDPEEDIASLEALLGKLDLDDKAAGEQQGEASIRPVQIETKDSPMPSSFGVGFGIGPGYGLATLISVTCDPNLTHGWRGRALPPVSRSFSANLERAQHRRPAVSGDPFDLNLEDFSLGMVGLSRLMSRVSELPDEQRLRYLLGTDNINV